MDTRCGDVFDGQGRQQAGKSKLSDLCVVQELCVVALTLCFAQDDTLPQFGRGNYMSCERKLAMA
jgi:hypothetical protein